MYSYKRGKSFIVIGNEYQVLYQIFKTDQVETLEI